MLLPLAGYSAQERFYVGTYSGPGKGEGIYTGVIDSETGRLGPISLAVKADSPSYLALSADAAHLYAVTSDLGGAIGAYGVAKDGALTFLNRVSSGGVEPCHISVDGSGRYVFVANYISGNITCTRIRPDGSLGERLSAASFAGSGPHPARQEKPFAHYVAADSGGRFLYACDLGTDHVWTYRFGAGNGLIQGLTDIQGKAPPCSGPRHLVFGPGERFAYVNGEMGRNVTVFRRDKKTGTLTAIQTLPLAPGAVPGNTIATAEIRCHPSGKWIYISSRGDDIIAVFAIGGDGRLTFVQDAPCMVKEPRGFGIDPAGRWVICAGQNDGRIAVLGIARESGKLAPARQEAKVPSPVDVLFAPPTATQAP